MLHLAPTRLLHGASWNRSRQGIHTHTLQPLCQLKGGRGVWGRRGCGACWEGARGWRPVGEAGPRRGRPLVKGQGGG